MLKGINVPTTTTVGASSVIPADSLVGSATFRSHRRGGHVAVRQTELLATYRGDHSSMQWECEQQFDSLGQRPAGMHNPDSATISPRHNALP